MRVREYACTFRSWSSANNGVQGPGGAATWIRPADAAVLQPSPGHNGLDMWCDGLGDVHILNTLPSGRVRPEGYP